MAEGEALLEIRGLTVTLGSGHGAVRGVDLTLHAGKVLGIVGESGSGKSMSMLAAMGLVPPTARVGGSVRYRGEELVGAPARRLRELRGEKMALIFQDPLTALNPVLKIGEQIAETVRIHHADVSRKEAAHRAVELLKLVSVPQPERRALQYPHEFSGGMRQRAMIAMAVANNPEVLIADEPTTALDVTVQAQILEVLQRLRQTLGVGLVLITHDLGVVAGAADTVAVMYGGKVVETGAVDDIFYATRHPYTRGLLASLPRLDSGAAKLVPIPGSPPSVVNRPSGCPFHPRCPYAQPVCVADEPALRPVGRTGSACHFAESLDLPATMRREVVSV
jgi:oligopeptide/dipeptide ABC transporter ATP-binding protein